ncbi:MAG: 16S rRNA (guanine(527)-N(7))-methyltransferase RsmG [Gottschalkiaceae bacterium]|nr:MAG: 16S rRNA (guanine(527)-N(7))-methyltransferase RsmG [Gottschalkiaceae bacterium]
MNNKEVIYQGLKELGIEVSMPVIDKLLIFKDIMLEWNEKINLTSITDERDIYVKHFLDSATCLSTGYIKSGMRVIDVGTGAGFPGIPVKIIKNDIKITFLDSLNKRINYLKEVVQKLELDDTVLIHGRAEETGNNKSHRESYDVVLSRAVASMNILCEYCLPFVKVGGVFLCQKGPNVEEELKEAEKAINVLGGKLIEIRKYKLPFSDIIHNVIIIEKEVHTPTKYPRKPGKPSVNPIK